jgi:uncharacterized protein YwqG
MIDKCVADVIWTTARELGTPDGVVEAVLKSVRPSIRLLAQHPKAGEEGRIGGCRIGGAPDLPRGVEWPRLPADDGSDAGAPLSFLLQVNLAEVAFADVERLLPTSGMLYFFFHLDLDGVADASPVLFARSAELRRAPPPPDLPADEFYKGFDLVPKLEWTVPPPEDLGQEGAVLEYFDICDELEDKLAAAQGYKSPRTYGPGHAAHRLIGHAQFIQSFGTGVGERLLLQVSSDAGLSREGYPESGIGKTWHDAGRIYYLIGAEALRSHRFEPAYLYVEMC